MRDEARDLLAWYDRHARDLPWRVGPAARAGGVRPDPYRVWLSEIMLQQTKVAAVRGYYERFLSRWPSVADLAAADPDAVMAAWAGLGYYARARNLLACATAVAGDLGGRFPTDERGLNALPGIGPYTAAAIAAIAFDLPATVVDGNVERVVARLLAVQTPLPDAKGELARHAAALTPPMRPGDFAQAMMDLGASVCTPRAPACGICPLRDQCRARALGLAATLPRRRPKAAKPVRRGIAWVGRRDDGLWLLERRPAEGLLGGMLGWPGSPWNAAPVDVSPADTSPADTPPVHTPPVHTPPADAAWEHVGEVRHTFTHFHLVLDVRAGALARDADATRGAYRPLDPSELPTLMRKAHALAAPALGG